MDFDEFVATPDAALPSYAPSFPSIDTQQASPSDHQWGSTQTARKRRPSPSEGECMRPPALSRTTFRGLAETYFGDYFNLESTSDQHLDLLGTFSKRTQRNPQSSSSMTSRHHPDFMVPNRSRHLGIVARVGQDVDPLLGDLKSHHTGRGMVFPRNSTRSLSDGLSSTSHLMFYGQNQPNRISAGGDPLLGTFDSGRSGSMVNPDGSTNSFASLPVYAFFNQKSPSSSSSCRVGDNISIQDTAMTHSQRVSGHSMMWNSMGGSLDSLDARKARNDPIDMTAFQSAKSLGFTQDSSWQNRTESTRKGLPMPASMFDSSFDKSSAGHRTLERIEPAAAVAAAAGGDLDSDQSSGIPDDEPLPLD
jgi:hypothetical protein